MTIIYHLAVRAEWEAAMSQEWYRAESLALEGFIHCSKDHGQVLAVANRLFPGRKDLLVLEVETDRLSSPLKHEPSVSGEIYPHIYGPLNTDAVAGLLSLVPAVDGRFKQLGLIGESSSCQVPDC